ncbi:ABC1 family-domain-containing protein [Truncatella angustata]|uniref:ABC1 family-domain-containing protein n=1 Tax=Truncatella angustata TaxID=152316 RepID=A0A9P8ZV77_9PEZI|nr:ABC1 family-domain-containing protein [Truncatella angustata]KAH6651780.1 ABC1 family-domain-containing protein [Truncatella angustata]KAH8196562.1 hypothetical protein TruAng_009256 [Truncatella angustata]
MFRPRIAGLCNTSQLSHSAVVAAASRRTVSRDTILQRAPAFPRTQRLPPASRRHVQTTSQFQPMRPPSPESLGRPTAAREFKRSRKWLRRLVIATTVGGTLYLFDRQLFASGITRSLRTFGNGLYVAMDYKLNFRPEPLLGGTVGDLHRRSAERLFELLRENGGLYLKIGQAIAMQSAVLPPEFQKMFARMFDDAPSHAWKDVEKVIRQDFGGKSTEEVFGVSFTGEEGKGILERKARASASVAQVHWARLPDGREVAIKIQKPEIEKQVGWDLWAFKVVMKVYTYWFDIPLYSIVPFISERLLLETDFQSEAQNSETMRKLISTEPSLKGRVYIPQVYPEFTTKRILVTEWIEGVRLWDKTAMTNSWRGGYGRGSEGVHGAQLSSPDMEEIRRKIRDNPETNELKPNREFWRGRNGKGGLGLSTKEIMTTIVDLFSAQIFKWGVVHCDPHPGNIFIRRLPSGRSEVVLIDHGLYVYMSPKFKNQYARFWKSLMTFDNDTIGEISEDWGIKAPDIFASATLMRPYDGGDGSAKNEILREMEGKTPAERHFEVQQRMKQGLREMLADEDKWPKELIFIGRNMRIVQGNNQFMGSPVNRIKMMGNWASRSLFEDPNLPWAQRFANMWRHMLFKTVLVASDVAFYGFKVRQWLGLGGGMEDEVEARMREMAKDFGVELQHEIFEG